MRGGLAAESERRFCELVRRLAPRPPVPPEQALDALDEQLSFRADVGYANPGREVVRVVLAGGAGGSPARDGGPPARTEVFVNRYVLAGLHGPLPEPYQELAVRRAAAGDHATAAFLDLFNHRINLLRFWLLARHEPGLSALEPAHTPLVRLAHALAEGCLPRSGPVASSSALSPGACPLSPQSVLGLAALLRHPHRSADAVQAVLRRVLRQRLELLPFRGGWLPRRAETYSKLGKNAVRLGQSSVLGTRFWDPGKGVELRLFPQTLGDFQAFLPGGERHARLCEVVRWVTRRQVDVHVVCSPPSGPPTKLSRQSAESGNSRLGYTARLAPGAAPAGPVRFTILAEDTQRGAPVP